MGLRLTDLTENIDHYAVGASNVYRNWLKTVAQWVDVKPELGQYKTPWGTTAQCTAEDYREMYASLVDAPAQFEMNLKTCAWRGKVFAVVNDNNTLMASAGVYTTLNDIALFHGLYVDPDIDEEGWGHYLMEKRVDHLRSMDFSGMIRGKIPIWALSIKHYIEVEEFEPIDIETVQTENGEHDMLVIAKQMPKQST